MRPSKVVAIVGCVVLICVLLICGLLYTTDANETDNLMSRYNKNTQRFDKTSVVTVVEEIRRTEDESIDGSESYLDVGEIHSWLDACIAAHHLMFHSGLTYSVTGSGFIDGMSVGCDCNGYIGVAMYLYGLQSDMSTVTLVGLDSSNYFDSMGKLPLTDLQAGDILVYPGHIEVFVQSNPTSGYLVGVYNWGSHATAEGLYGSDGNHEVKDCVQNVMTGSDTYQANQDPNVYRLNSGGQQAFNPPAQQPPAPQPPNPPGIPSQPPASSGEKKLNLPKVIDQKAAEFKDVNLGTSSKKVGNVGCFASSLQMAANYLVSPNSPWDNNTIINHFKMDMFTSGGGLQSRGGYLQALTGGKYTIGTDESLISAKRIEESIDKGLPVILHFDGFADPYYTSANGSGTHFVLVYGYNDNDILIQDPMKGRLTSMPKSAVSSSSSIKFAFIS